MITLTLEADTCKLSGRLDHCAVKSLWPQADTLLPQAACRLDLTQLAYSDTAGIAFLLELWHRAEKRGQSLQLVQPSSQLGKLIALYDLHDFFHEEA